MGECSSTFLGVSSRPQNKSHPHLCSLPPINTHTHTHTHRFYYYIPVVAVCVVAFLFPSGSGRSSGQKKPKTDPVTATTANDHSSTALANGEIDTDKKVKTS